MAYTVKEIFYTLQGEGANAGRPAVFCRFAGCNLWSGREADRANAVCQQCDTDFVGTDGPGGGRYQTAADLAAAIADVWPAMWDRLPAGHSDRQDAGPTPLPAPRAPRPAPRPLVVCTGGEPLLQMDAGLIDALHAVSFEIAVETNGTIAAPAGIDWLCVSPKARATLVQRCGDELKLVYPQAKAEPPMFEGLDFRHFFLQPMDGPDRAANTQAAMQYCLDHPPWRLSLQLHKVLGIP